MQCVGELTLTALVPSEPDCLQCKLIDTVYAFVLYGVQHSASALVIACVSGRQDVVDMLAAKDSVNVNLANSVSSNSCSSCFVPLQAYTIIICVYIQL